MTHQITTEDLQFAGCAVFNGKAFDILGRMCASYFCNNWIVCAPQNWQMQNLRAYGAAMYSPDCERPRFRVKATSQQKGQ